ncbi:hypothetical protein [Roseicella aquatilis]|uniref:Uncharacterized protein n=1 Tax=Roseicella aquatilis TaxID=2527868 RepID=A0A4R4D6A2_9PROT|nr:hypothetical protein [Roseicella aquatilis]TCZ54566.1 hypothetical protein EXY23_23115 [Roseicella aquatilis]
MASVTPDPDGARAGARRAASSLMLLAAGLQAVTGAYETAVTLLYATECTDPESPWLPHISGRADRLLTEIRARAERLAGRPARTLAEAVVKGRALRRYCHADSEIDAHSLMIVDTVCADMERLGVGQEVPPAAPRPQDATRPGRCRGGHRREG